MRVRLVRSDAARAIGHGARRKRDTGPGGRAADLVGSGGRANAGAGAATLHPRLAFQKARRPDIHSYASRLGNGGCSVQCRGSPDVQSENIGASWTGEQEPIYDRGHRAASSTITASPSGSFHGTGCDRARSAVPRRELRSRCDVLVYQDRTASWPYTSFPSSPGETGLFWKAAWPSLSRRPPSLIFLTNVGASANGFAE